MTLTPAKETAAPEPKPDEVSITLDGVEMSVPKGTLIIRAAEELGIAIPRFCEHPLLDPVGACRQCIVEVEGQRKPITACTQPVAEGMVISTQLTSEVAEKAQAGTMELLLINHPLDCPVCDKGGECPLQNQAMANGREESRFRDVKRTYPKPLAVSEQILLDRERCVLCTRCTRFSQQVAGDPFIELFERSANEQVGTSPDEPFESYFSGNTVQICPVGALTSAAYRFRARPFDLVSTPSVCEHCASGCAQRTDWRRGKVMRRLAGEDPEVNEEWNCDKGRFAFTYAATEGRITEPMVRDEHGQLQPASWTEALTVAAEGLREARDNGNGVGVLAGGRLTFEDSYGYAKFARLVLGTNDVDFRARPHSAEETDFLAARVAGQSPGSGGVTYTDLESAPLVLLVGFEPEEESPIVFLRLRKAVRAGTKVAAVSPWRTRGLRKLDGTLIETVPGAEPKVLDVLSVGGGGELADIATGLRAPGAVILVGERLSAIPGALSAVTRLAAATGARLGWVPRRAGERGALRAGLLPSLLPAEAPVTEAAARAAVAEVWGVGASDIPSEPGRDTAGMLTAATEGAISALLIAGVDLRDLPDPDLAEQALSTAGFVVSLEQRMSTVTERADVVLPIAPMVEKSGTFVNWEGRDRPFVTTFTGSFAMSDAEVLDTLAAELDVELNTRDVEAIRAEWRMVVRAVADAAVTRPASPEVVGSERAIAASGQAVLATWHSLLDDGSLQVGEPNLAATAPTPAARLASATAAEIGVQDGDVVKVSTEHGSVSLPVAVTQMPKRVVWLPTAAPGARLYPALRVDTGALVSIAAAGNSPDGIVPPSPDAHPTAPAVEMEDASE